VQRSIVCILLFAALVRAAGPPAFDVASVKVSHAPDAAVLMSGNSVDLRSGRMRVPAVGGTVSIRNWTLGMCILAAWDLGAGQLSGPSWLEEDRYDIDAKTSLAATQADVRQMLQALLIERFRLTAHYEKKEVAAYALVVANGGPRLQTAKGDQRLPVIFAPPSRLIGQGSSMQSLAMTLRRAAGRPVIDKTGLTGVWDFTLSYSPDESATDQGPSVFTALQEQLGLRLTPDRTGVNVLVVDHMERIPLPN
jgi:uncharacterized protein (TIGR03435 family)